MPGNGFTLTIRVGGEIEIVCIFQRIGDGLDMFRGFRIILIMHGKILIGLHRSVFRRQVANMPVGRQNGVVLTQILVDGFGFCR